MPNNADHCKKTLKRQGKDYRWVHSAMDSPSRILGKRHRMLFHDWQTIILLGLAAQDIGVCRAAFDHLRDDGVVKLPRELNLFLKLLDRR